MQSHRETSVCLLFAFLLLTTGCTSRQLTRDPLYQYSSTTIARTMDDRSGIRPNEIHRSTNFGFGTLSTGPGLLIKNGSEAFEVTDGGTVTRDRHETTVSYALLTKFDTDNSIATTTQRSRPDFTQFLTRKLKSRNLFYAVKVRGKFQFVELTDGPNSTTPGKKHRDLSGTLIGFRLPELKGSIREPGYRFVFLNRQKTLGGFVRNFEITEGTIAIDHSQEFTLSLPRTRQFYELKLSD